jgi:hypothetical protein
MRGRECDARAVLVRTSDTAAEADLRLEEIKRAVKESNKAVSDDNVWKELPVRERAAHARLRRRDSGSTSSSKRPASTPS